MVIIHNKVFNNSSHFGFWKLYQALTWGMGETKGVLHGLTQTFVHC